MNENHFIFSLIHQQMKKYGDISDDVSDDIMEWAVMCAARDWLIWTQDWDQSEPFGLSLWSQRKTGPKSWTTQCTTRLA